MERSHFSRPLPGHPIRRQFGRAPMRSAEPTGVAPRQNQGRGEDDLKLFALSFTAFFICIYTLIF